MAQSIMVGAIPDKYINVVDIGISHDENAKTYYLDFDSPNLDDIISEYCPDYARSHDCHTIKWPYGHHVVEMLKRNVHCHLILHTPRLVKLYGEKAEKTRQRNLRAKLVTVYRPPRDIGWTGYQFRYDQKVKNILKDSIHWEKRRFIQDAYHRIWYVMNSQTDIADRIFERAGYHLVKFGDNYQGDGIYYLPDGRMFLVQTHQSGQNRGLHFARLLIRYIDEDGNDRVRSKAMNKLLPRLATEGIYADDETQVLIPDLFDFCQDCFKAICVPESIERKRGPTCQRHWEERQESS
jgi:hypothetical protein